MGVDAMLDTGNINPNRLGPNGEPALLHAARYKNQQAVLELLARGADPTLSDAAGRTAYQYMAEIADQHPEFKPIRDILRMRHMPLIA